MAQKEETVFKNRIRPKLNALPNSWWVKIQQVVIRGTPDFLGCVNGTMVALELKKDDVSKISTLQSHNLSKIKKSGGISFIVTPSNWDKVYSELLSLSKKISHPPSNGS